MTSACCAHQLVCQVPGCPYHSVECRSSVVFREGEERKAAARQEEFPSPDEQRIEEEGPP